MNNDFLTKPKRKIPSEPQKSEQDILQPEDTSEDSLDDISLDEPVDETSEDQDPDIKKSKKKRRSPKQWFEDLSKKKKILFILFLVLLLAAGSAGTIWALSRDKPAPVVVKKAEPKPEPPKPTTEASKLTGVQVPIGTNDRAVTGIMIENSPDARPQSGLTQAGVVFEAVAEGGITRFLTLFQEAQPDYIGPVRSVRPYYLDWLQGFDAPIAHAGGSAEGLAKIRADGVKDLDQFANAAAYDRVNSRYAPHNLYTSMAKLDELKKAKGVTGSTFDGFPRKDEKAIAVPTAKAIDFNISAFLYNPHYDYDTASNSYKRSEGGKPHTDEKSGAQIAPKVVIALVTQYSQRGIYSVYNAVGSGKVYVYQDGGVTEGTWQKGGPKAQITFADTAGAPIKLNPGQTWITAVSGADKVKSTP